MSGDREERSAWDTSRVEGALILAPCAMTLASEIVGGNVQIFGGPRLDLLAEIGTQREQAVVVQFLVTSPADGVTHSFYFDLGF